MNVMQTKQVSNEQEIIIYENIGLFQSPIAHMVQSSVESLALREQWLGPGANA